MSYQVIARKWRPQTFEEVTGQEVITQTLRNALEFDRLHHAYLFSGARGVGKTTTARILAKALNCHKTDGKPNLTPCLLTDADICPSCLEISESRSMDVLEIDAASHTGIDDVRGTIIENINFSPARDRYKVFIVDEVHQLSKPAFNALLKTLEEPPDNVVFIMATTELHKVPETILSRCQEFEFRTIPLQKIFDRLKLIAVAEKIDISDEALRELARSGEGSMRDAQSNFDQVISFSSDTIAAADVTNALGFAGVEILTKTINAISGRTPRAVLEVVDDLISRGHDMRNFCRDLLGLFRDLLVYKVAADDKHLFEGAVFDEAEMKAMAAAFSEADLLRFFNSLCLTEASLREAAHPRYVLEIGLVKLIEMRSVATVESMLKRLDAIESGVPASPPRAAETAFAAPALTPPPAEKKTLKIEEPEPVVAERPRVVEPPMDEPPPFSDDIPDELYDDHGFEEAVIEPPPVRRAPEPPQYQAPPVRLLSLSAEELEHIEDTKLDDAYENKLSLTGDDLMPLRTSGQIITQLLRDIYAAQAPPPRPVVSNRASAAAVVPAFDVAKMKEEISPTQPDVELPVLSDAPTDAELREYAAAHPTVRAAMRVFRGKVVEVRKN
ncbi:hypothetical protein BH10ACI3_BH10ACI3_19000 [soil metagenome]